MTFGWASGYFISFFVPYRYCGLSAVAWSVFWSLLWSGQAIRIHDMPQAKFLFYSSGPRWFLEGFFYARPAWNSKFYDKFELNLTPHQASTVWPYKKVRYGPTKGDIYLKNAVTRYQQSAAYWQTYWQSMGYPPASKSHCICSTGRRRRARSQVALPRDLLPDAHQLLVLCGNQPVCRVHPTILH